MAERSDIFLYGFLGKIALHLQLQVIVYLLKILQETWFCMRKLP
jgi:hypothetical protein